MSVSGDAVVLVRACKYLALAPFIDKKRNLHVNKKYSLLIAVLIIATGILDTYFNYNNFVGTGGGAVLILYSIFKNAFKSNALENMFSDMRTIEDQLRKYHRIKVQNLSNNFVTAMSFGGLLILVATYSPVLAKGHDIGFFVITVFNVAYAYFFMMLLLCIAWRFKYTSRAIENLKHNHLKVGVVSKTRNLLQVHNTACNIVMYINDFFGVYIFNLTLSICAITLELGWQILNNKHNTSVEFIVNSLKTFGLLMTQILVGIISNYLSSMGSSCMVSTYQMLNWYVADKDISDSLSLLAQQTSSRLPVITGLGFFDVNHAFLFSLFNLLVTYFLVLIQFSMSSK